jgi:hypothetical protein
MLRRRGATAGRAVMRACSACAGEYEDPDRTAWTPDSPDEMPEDSTRDEPEEEFPVEE